MATWVLRKQNGLKPKPVYEYTEGRFETMSLNTIELKTDLDLHLTDADLLGSIGFAVDSPSTLPDYLDTRRVER